MTDCSHCLDRSAHPSFVLLLRDSWTRSRQPLRRRPMLAVGPFVSLDGAVQFRAVLRRVYANATVEERRAGTIALADKWVEIKGKMDEDPLLRVYGDGEVAMVPTAEQSLRLVSEAVRVLSGTSPHSPSRR